MSKPTTYILLFRGVGGATQLPVAPLREALTKGGFKQATTYINSGNAMVRSTLSRERVIAKVAKLCKEQFAFEKAIFAPTLAEWEAVIEKDPFPNKAEGKHVHAVLLAEMPKLEAIKKIQALAVGAEEVKVLKGPPSARFGVYHVCYIHTPNGFGTSKMAEKFDKLIGVVNTARNWNTVLKMRELAWRIEAE